MKIRKKKNSRFWAPLNNARSSLSEKSTSMRLAPASSCIIMPEVTIGVIPSSMRVPRLEAKMTRIQYKGSEESDDMIPYSGTWEQTKKIRRVTAVHSTFWLKGTCFFFCSREIRLWNDEAHALCDLARRLQVKLGEKAERGWGTELRKVSSKPAIYRCRLTPAHVHEKAKSGEGLSKV